MDGKKGANRVRQQHAVERAVPPNKGYNRSNSGGDERRASLAARNHPCMRISSERDECVELTARDVASFRIAIPLGRPRATRRLPLSSPWAHGRH